MLAPVFNTYDDGGVDEVSSLDFSDELGGAGREELKSYSVLWGELWGDSTSVAAGLVGDLEGFTNVGHLNDVWRVMGLLFSACNVVGVERKSHQKDVHDVLV